MTRLRPTPVPPVGLGVTSVTLAAIALMLFFLPILAIPIGIVSLLAGVAGLGAALGGWSSSLRWSVAGVLSSLVTLAIVFAIAFSAAGYIQSRPPIPSWQPVPGRPSVPPPMRPNWWQSASRGQHTQDAATGPSAQNQD